MTALTANDLKTRGVAAIEELLASQPEAMISVRGMERYVVMEVAHYHYLRECELDAALAQSQADVAAGRFVVQSAHEHMAQLEAMRVADEFSVPAVKLVSQRRKSGTGTRASAPTPAKTTRRGRPI